MVFLPIASQRALWAEVPDLTYVPRAFLHSMVKLAGILRAITLMVVLNKDLSRVKSPR